MMKSVIACALSNGIVLYCVTSDERLACSTRVFIKVGSLRDVNSVARFISDYNTASFCGSREEFDSIDFSKFDGELYLFSENHNSWFGARAFDYKESGLSPL